MSGHSCRTLTVGHSRWTFLSDTHARYSSRTLPVRHSRQTVALTSGTHAGHSDTPRRKLLSDTHVRHSYGTLTANAHPDTLVRHSLWTVLSDTHTRYSCRTLPGGHSRRTLTLDTLVGHSPGGHSPAEHSYAGPIRTMSERELNLLQVH